MQIDGPKKKKYSAINREKKRHRGKYRRGNNILNLAHLLGRGSTRRMLSTTTRYTGRLHTANGHLRGLAAATCSTNTTCAYVLFCSNNSLSSLGRTKINAPDTHDTAGTISRRNASATSATFAKNLDVDGSAVKQICTRLSRPHDAVVENPLHLDHFTRCVRST